MLLSAHLLKNVSGVNSFEYTQSVRGHRDEPVDVYFQLIDADREPNKGLGLYAMKGLRYMPAAGSTLECKLQSIDDSLTVTRFASQPWPTLDPSIWRLQLLGTENIVGTFALQLTLTDSGVIRRGSIQQAVVLQSSSQKIT